MILYSKVLPANGKPASQGNGTRIALNVSSFQQVDSLYNTALQLGATDEGLPGYRAEGFYAAYFRDLNGNKLNVHCMTES
jgi:predicted lactoylglutathione lyase